MYIGNYNNFNRLHNILFTLIDWRKAHCYILYNKLRTIILTVPANTQTAAYFFGI